MHPGQQKDEDEEDLYNSEPMQEPEPAGLKRSSRGRVVKPKRWDEDTLMASVPLEVGTSRQELAEEDQEAADSEDSGTDEHYSPVDDPEETLEQAALSKARRALSLTTIDPRGSIPVRDQAGRFVGVRPRTTAEQRQVQQESTGRGGGIFKSAAVEVLRQERRLMSTGEIARAALKLGLINVQGKTPEATMASALYTDIKRKEGQSIFIRPHEGLFGLREWADMGITFQEPEKPTYCLDDMKPFKRPATTVERARSTPQAGLPEFPHAPKAAKDNSGNRRLPLFLPNSHAPRSTLVKAASERLPDLPGPAPTRRVESHQNLAYNSLARSGSAGAITPRQRRNKAPRDRANSSNLDLLLDAAEELSSEEREGNAAAPAPPSRKDLNTAAEAPRLHHNVAIQVSQPRALSEHRHVNLELKRPRPPAQQQQSQPDVKRHNPVVTTGQPFQAGSRQPPGSFASRSHSQPLPHSLGINPVPDSVIIRSPSESQALPHSMGIAPVPDSVIIRSPSDPLYKTAFKPSEPQRSAFRQPTPTTPAKRQPRIAQPGDISLSMPQISKQQPSRPQASRPEPAANAQQPKEVSTTHQVEPKAEPAAEGIGARANEVLPQFSGEDLSQAQLGAQLLRQFEASLVAMEESFGKTHPKTGKAWLFMARLYHSFDDPQMQIKAQDALQRSFEICTSEAFQSPDD